MTTADVTILICTRNRAAALRETLASIGRTSVPRDLGCELLVANNGSTDGTSDLVREGATLANGLRVRELVVPQAGKSHAYNAAIAASGGSVLLCTDDDVRVPDEWVEPMVRPILAGRADAIAGGVRLAAHLERPWMRPVHRAFLASTERLGREIPVDLIGANMAFARRVVATVPGFDTRLGAGGLGFCEETLFSWQIREGGGQVLGALDVCVEHWPDPNRVSRAAFLDAVRRIAASEAYLAHHWEHRDIACGWAQIVRASLRLNWWRLWRRPGRSEEEAPEWEIQLLKDVSLLRSYRDERRSSRRYDRRGLKVRGGEEG